MSLVSLDNVSVAFGANDILEGISCEAQPGDRIGLVGRNGAGKTTLLRVLAGVVETVDGQRQVARGTTCMLVEQLSVANDSATVPGSSGARATVRSEALSGIGELLRVERELEHVAGALAAGDEQAAAAYAHSLDRLDAEGGYNYEARLGQILTGLGFPEADWDKPVATLSGGQRSRLGLARALLAAPDLLLLDEPTNHLDLDGLRWLEGFLSRWRGTVIITSHDRYFLDKAATRIWLVNNRRLDAYRGNYSQFERLRAQELSAQQKQYEAQQEFIAKEQAFIQRYGAGQRAKEARGRAKRLERVERIDAPQRSRSMALNLGAARSSDLVLTAQDLAVGYGPATLVRVGDLELERGERIALVGPNGAGKTTLLKTIAGELPPLEGAVSFGTGVRLGFYRQEAENLDGEATVLEEVLRSARISTQDARDLLGRFLFRGFDIDKRVEMLSGGERGRLALAKLVISRANLLLLDEPTNHLDIPSREALEDALEAYPGTIVFASHDRRLIARLATRLWIVEPGQLRQLDGTLEDYDRIVKSPRRAPTQKAAADRQPPRPARPPKEREIDLPALEAEIQRHEALLVDLAEEINQAGHWQNAALLSELAERFQQTEIERDRLVAIWLEAAEAASAIQ